MRIGVRVEGRREGTVGAQGRGLRVCCRGSGNIPPQLPPLLSCRTWRVLLIQIFWLVSRERSEVRTGSEGLSCVDYSSDSFRSKHPLY